MGEAGYFDGKTARRHRVSLNFVADVVVLEEGGEELARWAYGDIRQEDGDDAVMRLTSTGAPELARLEIDDKDEIAEIERRCPALLTHADNPRQTRHIVLWAMAAAVSLVVIAIWLMPLMAAEIAPLVPRWLERRIGDVVYPRMLSSLKATGTCQSGGPSGASAQALETLAGKLREANGLDYEGLQLVVLDSKVANAFALPGGRILILDGILQASESADEIAGILAHEMGHVAHRDGTRSMIEGGGVSFVLGTVLGDFAGATALLYASKALVNASFSREVEAAADAYAISTLRVLGRSPVPLGTLLTRLTVAALGDKSQPSLLDSHPATPARLAAMQASGIVTTGPPILSEEQFMALKRICEK